MDHISHAQLDATFAQQLLAHNAQEMHSQEVMVFVIPNAQMSNLTMLLPKMVNIVSLIPHSRHILLMAIFNYKLKIYMIFSSINSFHKIFRAMSLTSIKIYSLIAVIQILNDTIKQPQLTVQQELVIQLELTHQIPLHQQEEEHKKLKILLNNKFAYQMTGHLVYGYTTLQIPLHQCNQEI